MTKLVIEMNTETGECAIDYSNGGNGLSANDMLCALGIIGTELKNSFHISTASMLNYMTQFMIDNGADEDSITESNMLWN